MDDTFYIFPAILIVVTFTIICGCIFLCVCFAKKHRRRFPRVNRGRPTNTSTNHYRGQFDSEDTVHGFAHFPTTHTTGNEIGPPSYYEATAPSAPHDWHGGAHHNSNHHVVCDSGGGHDSGGGTYDSGGGHDSGGGTCDSGGGHDSGGGTCDSGGDTGGGCDSGGTD